MKYLIQHTYSIDKPWYLIPNFLNYYIGRLPVNNKFRFGVGKQEEELFGKGGYDGTEITAIITGLFNNNWQFNKQRISKFKKKSIAPIEVLHACTAKSKFERRTRADWDLNIWKDDEYTRNGISASILLAKELIDEIPIVNFHMGKYASENKKFVLQSLINNLKFAEAVAREHKVVITLENDYKKYDGEDTIGSDPKLVRAVLDEINSPFVKACYDFGHANVQARYLFDKKKITRKELENFTYHKRFIKILGEHIAYAHIHYNTAHILENDKEKGGIFYPSHDRNGDLHMPLNKIPKQEAKKYKDVLTMLREKTSIEKYGKIMLELTRDKMFGISFNKYGADTKDALESLTILKNVFENK